MSSDSDGQSPNETNDKAAALRAPDGEAIGGDDGQLSEPQVANLRDRLNMVLDPEILGDIDAWDLRRAGDWYRFSANMPGTKAPRGYLRKVAGGDVIAESPGAVLGMLSLGGARRAGALDRTAAFPHHLVAPADEVGAVGLAGTEAATASADGQILGEQTLDALIAAEVLHLRQAAGRGLPLIMVRTETDRSASIADLTEGVAFSNLIQAARNLNGFAGSLNKRARLLAVAIDFTAEDVVTPEQDFADGLRHLMLRLTDALWQQGFGAPLYLAMFDTTCPQKRQAQWQMAAIPAGQALCFTLPSYALQFDDYARLTPAAMMQRAMTEAVALSEIEAGRGWCCPVPLLAEWEPGKPRIRLRSNAVLPLVIDPDDPFKAGNRAGFALAGNAEGCKIKRVWVDQKQPQDVLIEVKGDLPRQGLALSYAWNAPGALRDDWAHPQGKPLRRWALPALLEVHG